MGCCGSVEKIADDEPEYIDLGCSISEEMSEALHEFFSIKGTIDPRGIFDRYEDITMTKCKLKELYEFLRNKALKCFNEEDYDRCETFIYYLNEIKKAVNEGKFSMDETIYVTIEC